MLVLALDTSGSACAVAVYDGDEGKVLSKICEPMDRGHAERLMEIIASALKSANKAYGDIERVVSTIGPGGFTGIRVGLATARGIGLGLGVDVVGVSTLRAYFETLEPIDGSVLVAIDARRGEAYYQLFDSQGQSREGPAIGTYKMVASIANLYDATICGTANNLLVEYLNNPEKMAISPPLPPIDTIAHIGAQMEPANSRPEPLYLRKADAKAQSGFALKRQ